MAKIYETREDLQREQLSRQLDHAQNVIKVSGGLTGTGALLFIKGLFKTKPIYEEASQEMNFFQKRWHNFRNKPADLRKVGAVIAAGGALATWLSYRKAAAIGEERALLGPEKVVLPPMELPPEECLPCKIKDAIQPRTLKDYAAKPEGERQVG